MDTLALLCNLHADGPATLLALRRAGFESLAALRRLEPTSLARTLDWNERTAERFLREATLLAARTGGFDEEAEADVSAFELESTLVAELDGPSDEAEGDDASAEELDEDSAAEPALAEPEGVEALLGAWRELDRVAPPTEPGEFVIPRPAPARSDRRLEELELDGLTSELRVRLAGLGLRTLRELAEANELELARALGLPYTRLKRLQFLARRALEQEPAAAPAARFEAYNPPPAEPFETAGPFA
ncbi:MAG: helix-hairpin-helix domain-containing protein [Planctomycetota bacterium]